MTDSRQTPGSAAFKLLTLATAIGMFLLILVGSVLRVTAAGPGCPDWPLCFGQTDWSFMSQTWLHAVHRILAGVVVLLTLCLALFAWRSYRRCRLVLWPATVSVLIILV